MSLLDRPANKDLLNRFLWVAVSLFPLQQPETPLLKYFPPFPVAAFSETDKAENPEVEWVLRTFGGIFEWEGLR